MGKRILGVGEVVSYESDFREEEDVQFGAEIVDLKRFAHPLHRPLLVLVEGTNLAKQRLHFPHLLLLRGLHYKLTKINYSYAIYLNGAEEAVSNWAEVE